MASTDQPAVSAGVGVISSATTTTTTTMPTVSQTALTSVFAASWSVLLPQITATIRKEVGEAMQQLNTTPADASGMSGTLNSILISDVCGQRRSSVRTVAINLIGAMDVLTELAFTKPLKGVSATWRALS